MVEKTIAMNEIIDWWLGMSIDIIQKKIKYEKHDCYDQKRSGLEMKVN